MSTDKQEASIPAQREAVAKYAAANGYTIVREYADEAVSGDATERRHGFLAMHKAACNGRDFNAILVWDSDRFGRFNSVEAPDIGFTRL
jgi:DNA invertase Pin-like site-specific DNA recombinase